VNHDEPEFSPVLNVSVNKQGNLRIRQNIPYASQFSWPNTLGFPVQRGEEAPSIKRVANRYEVGLAPNGCRRKSPNPLPSHKLEYRSPRYAQSSPPPIVLDTAFDD
jgi:hypothetical protein